MSEMDYELSKDEMPAEEFAALVSERDHYKAALLAILAAINAQDYDGALAECKKVLEGEGR